MRRLCGCLFAIILAMAGCVKTAARLPLPDPPALAHHAGPRIGHPAPEIVGEDLDGVEFRLSDYRGKVVVLDFWGHW